MRYIFLVLLLVLAAWFLGRDVLTIGEARRDGKPLPKYLKRFRRHAKGLILLIGIYLAAAFYEDLVSFYKFTAHQHILYIGLLTIMLIWVLILATRDLREVALDGVAEQQKILQESMQNIQSEVVEGQKARKKSRKSKKRKSS